jgi:hypothetical protein
VSRGSDGREIQEISDRGNQVGFGWANEPERNSDRLTRQWWLWFPAAGHQTTPQTLGWEQIVMATGRREPWRNPSLKGPSERPDPNGLPVCQTQAKAGKQV